MTERTFTVVAICCCGCEQNEIHILNAVTPVEAVRKVDNVKSKRVVAVLKGAHKEARKNAE